MNESLSIRLSPELRRELEQLSKRTQRSASEIAREALARYVAAEHFKVLRAKALPASAARDILTDEDVFPARVVKS